MRLKSSLWAVAMAAVIALLCSPLKAEEQVISGVGAQRCATLTAKAVTGAKMTDNLVTAMAFGWIQGFISSLNMSSDNKTYFDFATIPVEEQWVHVMSYCRTHPSELVMNAGVDLAHNHLATKPR